MIVRSNRPMATTKKLMLHVRISLAAAGPRFSWIASKPKQFAEKSRGLMFTGVSKRLLQT